MPNNGQADITEIISPEALASIDLLTAKLEETVANFVKINASTKEFETKLKNSKGIKELVDELAKLKTENVRLSESQTKVKKQQTELNLETVKARVIAQERLKVLKEEAAETLGLVGAYKRQEQELNHLRNAYKDLAASGQAQSKQAKAMLAEIDKLDSKLKGINESTGLFHKNVGQYERGFKNMAVSVGDVVKSALVFFGAQAGWSFLKDSVKQFMDAEQQSSRLKATLDNLGQAEVFQNLKAEATRLKETIKTIDDDDVLGVFGKLVDFGKLSEKQMHQLIPVIIDLAAKMGVGLPEAADAMIQALNGKGREMQKYGINMKDASSTTEAFNIIMTQLKPKVEGAAEAFGKTMAGQMKAAEVSVDELKESIGEKLQPVLKNFYSFVDQTFQYLPRLFNSTLFNTEKLTNLFKALPSLAKNAFTGDWASLASTLANIEGGSGQESGFTGGHAVLTDPGGIVKPLSNKTVGTGGRDEFSKDKVEAAAKQRAKEAEDLAKFIAEQEKKLARLKSEYATEGMKNIQDANQEIMENERLSIADRLTALKDFVETQQDIVKQSADLEISERQKTLDRINALKKKDPAQLSQDEKKEIATYKVINNEIRNLHQKRENDLLAITHDAKRKEVQILKSGADERLKALLTNYDKEQAVLDKVYSEQVQELQAQFSAGLIDQAKYNEEREKLELDYQQKSLKAQIEYTKKVLGLKAMQGLDVTKEMAAIAKMEMGLSDLVTKHIIDNDKKQKASKKTLKEAQKELVEELEKFGGEMLTRKYDLEKNRIQEQIDGIETKKAAEISAIEASTMSEEEKVKKVTMLNASADAQKEQLQQRQRQADQQKARFERDAQAISIIGNTASGVAEALPNIPLAITVGAIGAVQLATLMATPLPAYAVGSDGTPEGWGIWGEEGPEMSVGPDGKLQISPDGPMLNYFQQGTKIFTADETKQILGNQTARQLGDYAEKGVNEKWLAAEINRGIKKEMSKVASEIRNKPSTSINVTSRGLELSHENASARWKYLNSNLQSKI